MVFNRTYGGSSYDYIKALLKTTDNGLLLAGSTSSSKNGDVGDTTHGGEDYWVVKLNSNMDTLWTRSLGGYWEEELMGATLTGGTVVNAIVNGDVRSVHGAFEGWLLKLKDY